MMARRKVRAVHGPELVTAPWVASFVDAGAIVEGEAPSRTTLLARSPVHEGFELRLIFDWADPDDRVVRRVEDATPHAYGHKPDGSTTTLDWWVGSALAMSWLARDLYGVPDDPRAPERKWPRDLSEGDTVAGLHLHVLRVDDADGYAVIRGYDWKGPSWAVVDPRSFVPLEPPGTGNPYPTQLGEGPAPDPSGPSRSRGPSWGDDPNDYREGKRSAVGRP